MRSLYFSRSKMLMIVSPFLRKPCTMSIFLRLHLLEVIWLKLTQMMRMEKVQIGGYFFFNIFYWSAFVFIIVSALYSIDTIWWYLQLVSVEVSLKISWKYNQMLSIKDLTKRCFKNECTLHIISFSQRSPIGSLKFLTLLSTLWLL